MVNIPRSLSVEIFADGAEREEMLEMHKKDFIKGLTTNPTLMRKSGITDYRKFALDILSEIKDKPISFEVFTDDFEEMINHGLEIASWGNNVNVKVPITNSSGQSTSNVIQYLSKEGVPLNVTALLTLSQVKEVMEAASDSSTLFVSVFAGRIADTGRDPIPIMKEALKMIGERVGTKLIWASPRELLNVIQANDIGCHIITATKDILNKLHLIGKDLNQYSLETVRMFRDDSIASGYQIFS